MATDRRLSSETTEEREARLQILRENADGRLSLETTEEREARLQILRECKPEIIFRDS